MLASRLPSIVTGCGTLHHLQARWPLRRNARAFALLDAALEGGSTAFDTASAYGGGMVDRILGGWIRTRRLEGKVLVIGKGGHPDGAWRSRLASQCLESDLDGSRKALRIDAIDLYLLHRDDPAMPVGPIMETLHGFVRQGKVRAVGASNWSHQRIEEANRYAHAHGLTPFSASSPHFSLAEMNEPPWPGCLSITGDHAAEARRWYTAQRLPVLAWSPLAGGLLAGRDLPDDAQRRAYNSASNRDRQERARKLADEHGVPVASIALAYARAQTFTVHPIVSSSSPERLRALLKSASLRLSAEELQFLEGSGR